MRKLWENWKMRECFAHARQKMHPRFFCLPKEDIRSNGSMSNCSSQGPIQSYLQKSSNKWSKFWPTVDAPMTPFTTLDGIITIKPSQWKISFIIYSASAIITGTQENSFAETIEYSKSIEERAPSWEHCSFGQESSNFYQKIEIHCLNNGERPKF